MNNIQGIIQLILSIVMGLFLLCLIGYIYYIINKQNKKINKKLPPLEEIQEEEEKVNSILEQSKNATKINEVEDNKESKKITDSDGVDEVLPLFDEYEKEVLSKPKKQKIKLPKDL